ncbi:MAG TPA: CRISPR-associated endonuclease Cas2 [Clostridiaceae bacterium]|nr:CRISPR-associated endonuclease Cas2 [Clostridiaceae bacterium]
MYILVTYDVETIDKDGKKRLRKIAKICQNYGQRVQNSVFECRVNEQEYLLLKSEIMKKMDAKKDSVRFYRLGTKYKEKIEHFGVKEPYDFEEAFII